jgi:hypothetical protein
MKILRGGLKTLTQNLLRLKILRGGLKTLTQNLLRLKILKGGMVMKNKKISLGKLSCFSRGSRKKGISAVVATVLIILITVAAVTIIWAAIIPMINNQLSRGTVCLDAMTQLNIENKGYTCFDDAANVVNVQVSHGALNVSLVALQFLISAGGSTTSTTISDPLSLPTINGEKVIPVPYLLATADSVRIAPIVSVGNSQETCDALGAVVLKAC